MYTLCDKENESYFGFLDLGSAYVSENGISLILLKPAKVVLGKNPITLLDV